MKFTYCDRPLRSKIENDRNTAYRNLGTAICRGDIAWEDELRLVITTLDILYWLINARGCVILAGIASSEFPWRETPMEEFIF